MPAPEDALPLSVGQKINAVIRGESYTLFIRGWTLNNFIFTDAPKIGNEVVRAATNTGCNVNYIREGISFMFSTIIEQVSSQGNGYMVIQYPSNYDLIKLRKHDRYQVKFPGTYYIKGESSDSPEKSVARDLSLGGILISHPQPLEKGAKIIIKTDMPQGTLENLEAVVRNVRKNRKSEKVSFITGIKFINLSKSNDAILKSFMADLAPGNRRTARP